MQLTPFFPLADSALAGGRLRALVVASAGSAVYVGVQHTRLTPFPHALDDLNGRRGGGGVLSAVIGRYTVRRRQGRPRPGSRAGGAGPDAGAATRGRGDAAPPPTPR